VQLRELQQSRVKQESRIFNLEGMIEALINEVEQLKKSSSGAAGSGEET